MEKKDLYKVAIVEPKFKREEIFNKITENYCSNMITKIGNPQLLLFNIYQKSKTKSITINKHEKIMTIFSNIASKFSIYISPGVLIENIKGNVLPTAYLFNPEGELILKQREIFTLSLEKNLSKEDKNNLNKKNIKLNVVDTELGKLGFIINNDCFYPEIARFLSLKGVDIVLAVNNIIDDNPWRQISGIWSQVQQNQFYALEASCQGQNLIHAPCEITEASAGFIAPIIEKNNGLIKPDRYFQMLDNIDKIKYGRLSLPDFEIIKGVLNNNDLKSIRQKYPLRNHLNPGMYKSSGLENMLPSNPGGKYK